MSSIWTCRAVNQARHGYPVPTKGRHFSWQWGAKAAGGSLAGNVPLRASSSDCSRRSISSASLAGTWRGAFCCFRLMDAFRVAIVAIKPAADYRPLRES